jgi:hypothetical protein
LYQLISLHRNRLVIHDPRAYNFGGQPTAAQCTPKEIGVSRKYFGMQHQVFLFVGGEEDCYVAIAVLKEIAGDP